jgi:hypothetical protein
MKCPLTIFYFSAVEQLRLTSQFNEVGFFLEISGNPEISELKNSIWAKLGKSLGDLA